MGPLRRAFLCLTWLDPTLKPGITEKSLHRYPPAKFHVITGNKFPTHPSGGAFCLDGGLKWSKVELVRG